MAHIQERMGKNGKKTYRVQVRRKGQPIQSTTFTTKTAAQKWARGIESKIDDGKHFKTSQGKQKTVTDMVDRYIKNALPQKGNSTQRGQKHQLQWWKDQLGDLKLSELTTAVILEKRDDMIAKKKVLDDTGEEVPFYANASINRYIAALSAALTAAMDWDWLDNHLIRGKVKSLKENKRTRWLNDKELKALLTACRNSSNPILYDIVLVDLCTGMRRSEVTNLTWDHVDLDNRWLYVDKSKNEEKRGIFITDEAYEVLKRRHDNRDEEKSWVFPSEAVDKPFVFKKLWEKAVEEAGLEDFKFHDLRHSFASYMAISGVSPQIIQKITGHKDLKSLERYLHLMKDHTTDAISDMTKKYMGDAGAKKAD
ncbi:MAG: integrase [Micavibrio sp.]|nr:MAG: integrase [Micavibrio sp.]